jgi:hypothetical protein
MNCFDCALAGRTTTAIGTCMSCGGGVCAAEVQLDVHELPHTGSPGNYTHRVTRSLICQTCAAVITEHLPDRGRSVKSVAGR